MTKEDMVQVLRSVGCNENTITAMCNAFDMGAQYEREECAKVLDTYVGCEAVAAKIRARIEP